MAFAVLFSGGGPDGLAFEAINPVNAFAGNGVASAAIGLGLFMAFWSWIGFEATAVYGEESRNPRKVIPIATFVAVIGIGVMYTFFSWMAVAGNGLNGSVAVSAGDEPFQLFFGPTREYLGSVVALSPPASSRRCIVSEATGRIPADRLDHLPRYDGAG